MDEKEEKGLPADGMLTDEALTDGALADELPVDKVLAKIRKSYHTRLSRSFT